MRYRLRSYQIKAVQRARDAIAAGRRRPLLVAPTGSGKTVIASFIVESATRKRSRTLFIAHRIELIAQASAKLDEIGIDHGVIKAGHHRVRPTAAVQIASVQTLARRVGPAVAGAPAYDLIIVDEAHHVTAGSYRKVLDAFPNAVVLGLTATPYRADGAALGDVFDALLEVASVPDLIDAGHLVEPRVFGRKPPDLSQVRTVAGDYNLGQLADVMDRDELVGDIVTTWKEKAAGRVSVAFAVNVAHSRHIAEVFNRAGVPAGHVDGMMPEAQRAAVLAKLASGELTVVANCAILTEGWDLPQCSCVVLARPTKSRSLWKQMCGRALRPAPELGKQDCLVLDHSGCWKRHGFLTDPEELSLQGKEKRESVAPSFRCPSCGAELRGWPRFCPECEEELPRSQPQASEGPDGELEELRPIEELIGTYQELARVARERRYQAVWVGIKFRERYGFWPHRRHMGDDPRLITRMEETGPGKWKRVWLEDEPALKPERRSA